MTLDLLSLLAGLLIGAALVFFFMARQTAVLREKLRHEEDSRGSMGESFGAMAQEALRKTNEQFLQLAQEKMKQADIASQSDLDKRQKAIAALVEPIGKTLQEMDKKVETLGKAGAGLETQLRTFAEDQRLLRQETQNLVQALRNPAARGRWGEMQLQRAFEMIGMIEGTHYVQQESVKDTDGTRRQPDFIIKLPGGMQIIIDVKAPIEPYWNAMESADSEAAQAEALNNFRRQVREHLKELKSREYWRLFDGSPEFVVMFLPTEGLYSTAVSNDPGLIEEAARANVILASPTTLMGLLRVAMYGWQQQNMAEEARTVANLASELYNRIAKFGEHMQKLGRNLNTALGAYNQAVGSLESSVLPGARKFKELHVQTGGREIPDLPALEETPRALSSPELLGSIDDSDTDEEETKRRA